MSTWLQKCQELMFVDVEAEGHSRISSCSYQFHSAAATETEKPAIHCGKGVAHGANFIGGVLLFSFTLCAICFIHCPVWNVVCKIYSILKIV